MQIEDSNSLTLIFTLNYNDVNIIDYYYNL